MPSLVLKGRKYICIEWKKTLVLILMNDVCWFVQAWNLYPIKFWFDVQFNAFDGVMEKWIALHVMEMLTRVHQTKMMRMCVAPITTKMMEGRLWWFWPSQFSSSVRFSNAAHHASWDWRLEANQPNNNKPKKWWMDGIVEDMQHVNVAPEDTMDRARWKQTSSGPCHIAGQTLGWRRWFNGKTSQHKGSLPKQSLLLLSKKNKTTTTPKYSSAALVSSDVAVWLTCRSWWAGADGGEGTLASSYSNNLCLGLRHLMRDVVVQVRSAEMCTPMYNYIQRADCWVCIFWSPLYVSWFLRFWSPGYWQNNTAHNAEPPLCRLLISVQLDSGSEKSPLVHFWKVQCKTKPFTLHRIHLVPFKDMWFWPNHGCFWLCGSNQFWACFRIENRVAILLVRLLLISVWHSFIIAMTD